MNGRTTSETVFGMVFLSLFTPSQLVLGALGNGILMGFYGVADILTWILWDFNNGFYVLCNVLFLLKFMGFDVLLIAKLVQRKR